MGRIDEKRPPFIHRRPERPLVPGGGHPFAGRVADIDVVDAAWMFARDRGVDLRILLGAVADEDEAAFRKPLNQFAKDRSLVRGGFSKELKEASILEPDASEVERAGGEAVIDQKAVKAWKELPRRRRDVVDRAAGDRGEARDELGHALRRGERLGKGAAEQAPGVADVGDLDGVVDIGDDADASVGQDARGAGEGSRIALAEHGGELKRARSG